MKVDGRHPAPPAAPAAPAPAAPAGRPKALWTAQDWENKTTDSNNTTKEEPMDAKIYYNNNYEETQVAVSFAGNAKHYVYRCDFKVRKGDLVVVYASGEYKVVTVQAVGVATDYQGELKCIIDVVNVKRFETITKAKAALADIFFQAERKSVAEFKIDHLSHLVKEGEMKKGVAKKAKALMNKIANLSN